MSVMNPCPKCGGPLPDDVALGGGCPRCMLELGFETTVGSSERRDPRIIAERPAVIGRYRILRLIGEGGMGAVYEAEQDHPRRTVALKIIKSGMASAELLRRFEQESQALGRLQHPGIAQIYEAGTVDTGFGPQPYFAMELIRGRSPRDYAEAKHWNVRERLQMMVKICDAVHHAHQRGLIHRDLKPGNILVDETGQPKILDFGVVRVTDSDARATLQTDMGQLIGTLAYMSPEQALADPLDIDTRSDVYSLGVILYELLSGRLPYTVSKKVHEAIHAIREEDPARLSTSNRTYRGDIETIVAKSLEKDRERRYASAAEMAADIQRYLNDEPIVARRPSVTYQLKKFAWRNKALVTGVAAVFVVLVGGVTASTWYAARVTQERDRAVKAEYRANENVRAATLAGVRETEQRQVAEAANSKAEEKTLVAEHALSSAQTNLYFNNIALADREWQASNTAHVDQLLKEAPASMRNWEWHYLTRLNHMEGAVLSGHREAILATVLDSDGKVLRTVDANGTFKDWDLSTQKEIAAGSIGRNLDKKIGGLALRTDGRSLYLDYGMTETGFLSHAVKAWVLSTGKSVFSLLSESLNLRARAPNDVELFPVAMSPDGKRVVPSFLSSSDLVGSRSTLRTSDTGTGREEGTPIFYAGLMNVLAFSPDGDKLLVGQTPSKSVLSAATGEEISTLENSRGDIAAVAFSRDSATIAASIYGEGIREWSTSDGRQRWSISSGSATRIEFSPDSRTIAVAMEDRTIRILDSVTGHEGARLMGHTGTIEALSFTPDGKQLVSAGKDKLIRIWDLRSSIPGRIIDVGRIESPMQVNPNTKTLLTATGNGLKLWDLSTGRLRFESGFLEIGRQSSFSKDGSRILSVNKTDGQYNVLQRSDLQLLDASTGGVIALLHPPDGKSQVSSDTTGFQLSRSGNRAGLVLSIRPSPSNDAKGEGYVWDIATGRLINRFDLDVRMLASFQLSPDGKLAALSAGITRDARSIPDGIEIYDTTTGHRRHGLNIAPSYPSARSTFSPDGNRLLVVDGGRSMTIWDVWTGLKIVSFPEAGKTGTTLTSTDFSPDGTRLVSVSSDGEVWLWDAGSGKVLIPLRESSGPYEVREFTIVGEKYGILEEPKQVSITFSPDGGHITLTTITSDRKGAKIRIETWDGSPLRK